MKYSCTNEDGMTVLHIDEANTYAPKTEKERRITLSILKTEARYSEKYISEETNATYRKNIIFYLNTINQLIDIYNSGSEFTLTTPYRKALSYALSFDKKHRKASRRILRNICAVPYADNIEIGGVFDFNALHEE